LAVPPGEVWGVAPEGMDAAAAIPFACACALLRLSDTSMFATGLVPSKVKIGDVAVEGVADPDGADCGVADAPPLSDGLLSEAPVVPAAFPEGLLPAGLAGAPLEASLLAGPPLGVPDVVGPVESPGVSEGVPPEDAGLTTELAGVTVAGFVEGPAAEEPVL
jgi:hypothetical protein